MTKYLLASIACILHFLSLLSVAQAVTELTTQEFNTGIQNGDYDIIIDVRRQDEWDLGHIEDATLLIDLALGGEDRYSPILGCKEACVIAVYCRSGARARAAAAVLETAGFNAPVYNGQGVSQWTGAGYPLVTTPSFKPACMTNENFVCPDRSGEGEEDKEDAIELTSEEFYNGIQNGDYDIVIDVRRQDEWDQGHIENATLVIDLALGGNRFLPILDCKDACSIAVYCRSGARARAAAKFLASVGFSTPIYNGQGVSQWTAAGYPLVTNTPSFEPECLTKAAYICPDSNSGGVGVGFGICFSGDMEVQVKDKGFYKMKDLRIGDEVLVEGDDVYESIYSLAHADSTQKAQFLQLLPSGLELSENHMVFIENKGAVPARMVQVGDKLVMVGNSKNKTNESVVVEQIKKVIRRGVFAPFTKSGTIVVNGILASTFIAFQPAKYLTIGSVTTPFTYQWLARTFQLPQYWFGRSDDNIKMTEGGMSSWIARPFDFANWLFLLNDNDGQQQNVVVMIIMLPPIIALLIFMSATDVVFTYSSLSIGVALVIGSFIVLHRGSSAKKTIHNPKTKKFN